MVKMGFLSLVAVLCCAHLAYGDIHSHMVIYTASSGIPGIPEFVGATIVDGQQVNYYDSTIKELIPKQEWVKGAVDSDFWKRNGDYRSNAHQVFKANIEIARQRFNQTEGVHTFQYMYGCQWDDDTHAIDGFNQYAYDGEDFITLDLKDTRFIGTTPQSLISTNRWNSEAGRIAIFKQYFKHDCIEWLKKYVQYGSSTLGRKVDPEVSLVQKGPEVACHATGFYPDSVMITWKKDGVEVDDDVDVGETLPNEDGTFQKRSVLTVPPEERENAQYSCEVTHKGSIFRPREPRTVPDAEPSSPGLIPGVVIGVILLVALVALAGFLLWKKRNSDFGPVKTTDDVSASSDEAIPQKV